MANKLLERVPLVLNRREFVLPIDPRFQVYVGRPSKWGNPFEIGKDGDRTQVIEKYGLWLNLHPDLLLCLREELRGKDLVCWCAPLPCHADILLELANG